MRVAEWIQLVFVSLVTVAAWIRSLAHERRRKVAALGAGTITAILAERLTVEFASTPSSFVVRDWLPAALLLVPYAGWFRTPSFTFTRDWTRSWIACGKP